MRKPLIDSKITVNRRKDLAKYAEQNSAFILFSGSEFTRNNDANFPFRVHSDFYYLTGYEESESVVLIRPGKSPESVAFVRKKDPLHETWEGFLFGPEGAKEHFGFDEAFTNDLMFEKLCKLLVDIESVYYRVGINEKRDAEVFKILNKVLSSRGRKGGPLSRVLDPEEVLGQMRRRKDKTEIELMRKSAQIAASAHIDAMKSIKPGMNEREIQGIFYQKSLAQDARDVSYNSICAGGDNATTLHYNSNDQELKDGDLFLIDAGAEYNYYASDITRTYPVNGKFSEAQKEVYQAVLTVQKNMIDRVKPGVSFQELNEKANEELTQAMVDMGLLKGNVRDLIKENKFKKYYPHSLGHYLGLDVHDTGPYMLNKESRPFDEGVVLTIEPGIYVPLNDDEAPKKFLGIGVRIEDDILVTSEGCEVLSAGAPKEIKDIESVMS